MRCERIALPAELQPRSTTIEAGVVTKRLLRVNTRIGFLSRATVVSKRGRNDATHELSGVSSPLMKLPTMLRAQLLEPATLCPAPGSTTKWPLCSVLNASRAKLGGVRGSS